MHLLLAVTACVAIACALAVGSADPSSYPLPRQLPSRPRVLLNASGLDLLRQRLHADANGQVSG
jgi:hypothetical protein